MDKIKKILEDIKENPLKLFPLIYPYVLTVGIIIGLFYLSSINDVSRKKVMPRLPDSTMVTDFELLDERVEPAVDLKAVLTITPEMVTKGETLFKNTCVTCHGELGKGDGVGGAALNPKPRNFTSLDGWKNGPKLINIYKTLEEGIPNSGMISYKQLTAVEKFALGQYIHSKFLPNAPKETNDEIASFDAKYQLTKGVKLSAQMPVVSAEKILLNEVKAKTLGLDFGYEKEKVAGALILKRIIKNKETAANWLLSGSDWKISEHNLRSYLTRKLNQNGFNKQVQYLSSDEWMQLFDYLVKKIS